MGNLTLSQYTAQQMDCLRKEIADRQRRGLPTAWLERQMAQMDKQQQEEDNYRVDGPQGSTWPIWACVFGCPAIVVACYWLASWV